MKIKTFLRLILLLCTFVLFHQCSVSKNKTAALTVEEAEDFLEKEERRKNKIVKKEKKRAYEKFWEMQTKAARKSIQRNAKNQKRIARAKKRI
jgi:hypothetical protein